MTNDIYILVPYIHWGLPGLSDSIRKAIDLTFGPEAQAATIKKWDESTPGH